MSDHRTVLFIGGHAAGKTNLLIRLWMALRNGGDSQITSRGLPADLNYLNDGMATQLAGGYAEHTPAGLEARPSIPVSLDGVDGDLLIPDRPGEDWTRFYNERRWPDDWLDLIRPTTTCLLLVRSKPPEGQVKDWLALQHFLGPQANFNMAADHSKDPPPAQVILVDWIQLIAGLFQKKLGRSVRPRIGVIITAWDDLDADAQVEGPMEHLRNEHKLLFDFITNNRDRMDIEVFGVTLFGGDLNNAEFADRLVDAGDPRKNGAVAHELAGQVEVSPDLMLPIVWALRVERR